MESSRPTLPDDAIELPYWKDGRSEQDHVFQALTRTLEEWGCGKTSHGVMKIMRTAKQASMAGFEGRTNASDCAVCRLIGFVLAVCLRDQHL